MEEEAREEVGALEVEEKVDKEVVMERRWSRTSMGGN